MADITNPEGIRYCNEQCRPIANALLGAYNKAKAGSLEWTANDMGAILTVSADVVADGSATDGRHQITGNDANLLKGVMDAFIGLLEGESGAKLNVLSSIATNQGS